MKLAIVVWVPFLVSALSAQVAPYNSSERAQLVLAEARSLETDIKTIRPKLFQNLDRHEAEIVAPIEFEVPDGHNLHSDSLNDCYAFRDPFGTPKVHIGLAFAPSYLADFAGHQQTAVAHGTALRQIAASFVYEFASQMAHIHA